MIKTNIKSGLLSICFLFVLVFTFIAYFPGLNGPFIFDDIPNLEPLGFFGGIQDLPSALFFVFGNESGPLGRPLSMLTFLINDVAWPSEARSFKYTNLLLHLLNGCLIFKFLLMLGRRFELSEAPNNWLALISSAVWLLHPLNVSTVLFVIQRMTILSSMFILIGLIVYMHFRRQEGTRGSRPVLCLASLSVIGTVGLLFKETTLMLVVYVALIEAIVFPPDQCWKKFRALLAIACISLILAVLVKGFLFSDATWSGRGFGPIDRLFTQSRILWEYFFHVVIPRTGGTGLLHDDYQISTGLLSPISTLIAFLGLLATIFFSVYVSRFLKVLSLSILWFLGGHFLESTVLPLENYFEHRNYLPMLLIIWSAGFGLFKARFFRPIKTFFIAGYSVLLMFVLYSTVLVWSDESLLIKMWSLEHPDSPRAQQIQARELLSADDVEGATKLVQSALEKNPEDHHLMLQFILLQCLINQKIDLADYNERFQLGVKSNGIYDGLQKLNAVVVNGGCDILSADDLIEVNNNFISNRNYQSPSTLAFLYKEIASLHVAKGDLDSSIMFLDKAYLADNKNIIFPLTQAYWLNDAGLKQDAMKYLDVAKDTEPRHYMQRYQYMKLYRKAKSEIGDNGITPK